MSIRNAGIGPQCYGRRSDAVVCVYSGKAGRFADIFNHVCEGDDAKWPLLEPHIIFRTEICLRILKKSTAIRVHLFKVELQSLVAIVLVFCFVDSCFFLVTGFVIDTTLMVFGSFIVGHGCKLSPSCINELHLKWSELFVLRGLFGKRKERYETTHFVTAREGKKAKKHHWL